MSKSDINTYIDEEAFIVLHSGEIPEIALHGSLYYLTEDPDGPGLELGNDDILPLKQAVVERYRKIILRDLDPRNRDKKIYRRLERCAVNWQRLHKFCSREGLDFAAIGVEFGAALQNFLQQELLDVHGKKRFSSINCSRAEVSRLAISLGLLPVDLPPGWQELCPGAE